MWLLLSGIAVYVLLVAFGAANGIRGDDQFWYLADIETLVSGADAVTNFVFPYTVATDGYAGHRPFVHNILYPYLSAIPAILVGPLVGAIFTNAISQIFASIILFSLILRLRVAPVLAAVMAVLFLLFPMTYWYSINVYSETTLPLFILALAVILLHDDRSSKKWMVAAVLVGFMIFARASFLLLGLLLPFAFLVQKRPISFKRGVTCLALLSITLTFNWIWSNYFPNNVECPLIERLNVNIPGETGTMYCAFRMPGEAFMFFGWIEKVFTNLYRQFGLVDLQALLFFWPVNLMIFVGAFVLIRSTDKQVKTLGWLNIGLVLVHLGTLVISQIQFRYLVILVPISFILLAVFFTDNRRHFLFRHPVILSAFVLIAFVAMDIGFAQRVRAQAAISSIHTEQLLLYFSANVPMDDRVLIESSAVGRGQILKDSLKLGYSLNPRPSLLLPTARYERDEYEMIVERFRPDMLVLMRDSTLHQSLDHVNIERISDLPGYFSNYSLYAVQ